MIGAPGNVGPRHKAEEEFRIQFFEDFFQMVLRAFRAVDFFAPPDLPDQVRFSRDALAAGKLAEARCLPFVDALAIKLGDQDMQDGVQHVVRRTLHEIGETDQDASFAETNGIVQIGKREELYLKFGKRRAGPQFPVGLLE